MLRSELDIAYQSWITRPGEELGVLDNLSDYEECKRRVHCNSTHLSIHPVLIKNDEKGELELDEIKVKDALSIFSERSGRRHTVLYIGDSNNVYFPYFYLHQSELPESLMQDQDGEFLSLVDPHILNGQEIAMPAIDDADLIALNKKALLIATEELKHSQYVSAYVVGAEILYPEYFSMGRGDYRPASLAHYRAFCESFDRLALDDPKETASEDYSPRFHSWYQFREQAMADRTSAYYQTILSNDSNHLVYYPTHGSLMNDSSRLNLGQLPDRLAAACDGLEIGHIMIGDDEERRNILQTSLFTSYGAPVIIPRLGNKQADLHAIGGGKSFTPTRLRRYVYEALGMGMSNISPIHWTATLHDGEWHIKDTPAEQACREVFDEIHRLAPSLMGMARLQPQLAVYVSDSTWIESWNPAWAKMIKDALEHQVHMSFATDIVLSELLVDRIPLLISLDNYRVSDAALDSLLEYLDAGGTLLVGGSFAKENEYGSVTDEIKRNEILNHANAKNIESIQYVDQYWRERFLTGPEYGVSMSKKKYSSWPIHEWLPLCEQLNENVIYRPLKIEATHLKSINVYPLTNRASLAFVLINLLDEEQRVRIQVDERVLSDIAYFDALTMDNLDVHDGFAELVLAPNGSRVICAYSPDEDMLIDAVESVEQAFDLWRDLGADVRPYRMHWSAVASSQNTRLNDIHAQIVNNCLGISSEVDSDDAFLNIRASIFDANGNRVEGATVSCRLTPGSFKRYRLTEEGAFYHCQIAKADLLPSYDYEEQVYKQLDGHVRIILDAKYGDKAGGSALNVKI